VKAVVKKEASAEEAAPVPAEEHPAEP